MLLFLCWEKYCVGLGVFYGVWLFEVVKCGIWGCCGLMCCLFYK